jgi:uncharacterized repeat protein (TIGR03803 family)
LHTFGGTHADLPNGGLIQATDGNLCGTTQLGGASHWGNVFCLDSHGVLTTLHSFNLTNGAEPVAALLQAAHGKLYGTASQGGADDYGGDYGGTIFEIIP